MEASILGASAHHPSQAKAFFTLNAHLLLDTSLTERQRELVLMRVTAVRRSSYERVQHLFMARDAGLAEIEIAWIAWGPDTPPWNAGEASLLRAVDELVFDGVVEDSTWAALTEHMSAQETLDIIYMAGAIRRWLGCWTASASNSTQTYAAPSPRRARLLERPRVERTAQIQRLDVLEGR